MNDKEMIEEEETRTAVFSNEYKPNGNYEIYEVTTKKALGVAENGIRITEVSPFEHPAPMGEIPHVGPIVKPVLTWYPDAFLADLCNEGILNGMMSENDTISGLLETLCEQGLIKRYSNILPLHRERLAREMGIINQKEYAGGFLVIHDLIKFARSKNLLISPGCGALPGSLVAYCLGITEVDPLREDLIFERYLNSEKETHSYGIRIDVEKGAKTLIVGYLAEKYGEGMPKLLEMADIHIRERVELSIIKETIENISKNKGINVDLSAIDKNDPDVYKYLCSGATEGVYFFDKDDPHTYTTGGWFDDEMKCHKYHPPIVMEDEGLFRAIMPKTMNELMAYLCLDRRLPEELVERYVHNKNNPDCITYECPDLEPILDYTYGCLVYQEQVMWILQVLGGFSPEQSDLCRRALSKKQSSITEGMRKQFVEGATSTVPGYFANRIDEDTAVAIYDKLCYGAPYCFNKTHAVTETMMIYDMEWLNYYYSSEFQEAAEKYKDIKSDVLP